jgi:glycosyltransferase involved in cell wall biosynthesis
MLKSLHIIGSRQMGGAESFFMRLVKALNGADHRASVAVRPESPLLKELDETIPVHQVAMRNGWDLFSVSRIRRLVKSTGVDVVQTYMGRASRLTRLPKDARAIHVARLGGFYKIDGYYRHADAWVGNTKALCDYLVRQGLPVSRVFHISNFVELPQIVSEARVSEVRNQLGVPDEAIVVFSLGRFIDIKGFEYLIRAFSRLEQNVAGRPVHLVLAGDGPLRHELLALAEVLRLGGRFHWAGWVRDPAPYMSMADLFIVPSTHETLGNVILEAWSYELPVISTCTPGALELIEDGRNGRLVPCKDDQALAATIRECLSTRPGDLAGLGTAGKAALDANHSSTAITGAYLDMYASLCGPVG